MSTRVDQLNKKLDEASAPSEIYMNKEAFKEVLKTPIPTNSRAHGIGADPDKEPIVEKALGSTKKIGTYGRSPSENLPVYSHGEAKDKIVVK